MKQVKWQKVLVTAMCGSLLLGGSPFLASAEENQPDNVPNNVLVEVEEAEDGTTTTTTTLTDGTETSTEAETETPVETTKAEADSKTEPEAEKTPEATATAAAPAAGGQEGWQARSPQDIQITGATYVVQWGDTLWAISEASGVSVETLLSLNPQTVDRNLIYTGETLTISAN